MERVEHSYWGSSIVPFRMVFIMWLVFTIEVYSGISFAFLGLVPRSFLGLIGIITAPLLHGNIQHLISNTVPVLFLGSTLFYFYRRIGGIVFFRCYVITNVLVWLFSPRISFHIGASGLVYGLASFLIFFGLLRRDFMSLMISIIVTLIYGGIFYGVLPTDPRVSWETHLAGALVGVSSAFQLRHTRRLD